MGQFLTFSELCTQQDLHPLEGEWENAPVEVLNAAALVLQQHGANLWVFSADARHFWQFASRNDTNALYALTAQQHAALLGEWDSDEWEPEYFGYSHPKEECAP